MPFINNPDLETLKPDWQGNPIDKNGRFKNHIQPMDMGWRDVWKWQSGPRPDKKIKNADPFRLIVQDATSFMDEGRDGIVWLGHASYLIRLGGKLMIIDPVLESPSMLMKRYSTLPLKTESLRNIDLLLLSHDHRDHADSSSIKKIGDQNPNLRYLTGLNLGPLIRSWTGSKNFQEAGWYQKYTETFDLNISYLPSRHWGRRWLTDTNLRLWGGFMIQYKNTCIYFAGDSGYGPHFKEIAEVFPEIDYAMIGIGAFKPEWFMSASHTSPALAYEAFKDSKAKKMLPMHFGTFDLADETLGEPHRLISNIGSPDINMLEVGQILYL